MNVIASEIRTLLQRGVVTPCLPPEQVLSKAVLKTGLGSGDGSRFSSGLVYTEKWAGMNYPSS
jgi:hypothetical protein